MPLCFIIIIIIIFSTTDLKAKFQAYIRLVLINCLKLLGNMQLIHNDQYGWHE